MKRCKSQPVPQNLQYFPKGVKGCLKLFRKVDLSKLCPVFNTLHWKFCFNSVHVCCCPVYWIIFLFQLTLWNTSSNPLTTTFKRGTLKNRASLFSTEFPWDGTKRLKAKKEIQRRNPEYVLLLQIGTIQLYYVLVLD